MLPTCDKLTMLLKSKYLGGVYREIDEEAASRGFRWTEELHSIVEPDRYLSYNEVSNEMHRWVGR